MKTIKVSEINLEWLKTIAETPNKAIEYLRNTKKEGNPKVTLEKDQRIDTIISKLEAIEDILHTVSNPY